MLVYLIRHGLAGDRRTWSGPDDLRPLTPDGVTKMERVARGLKALDVKLDALWSSPLVRARETAEIVQAALGLERLEFTDLLHHSSRPEDMLPFLARLPKGSAVGLTGHEPHLSLLLAFLLTAELRPFAPFKKGGVACVEVDHPIRAGRCALRWLMTPKQLALLGEPHAAAAAPQPAEAPVEWVEGE